MLLFRVTILDTVRRCQCLVFTLCSVAWISESCQVQLSRQHLRPCMCHPQGFLHTEDAPHHCSCLDRLCAGSSDSHGPGEREASPPFLCHHWEPYQGAADQSIVSAAYARAQGRVGAHQTHTFRFGWGGDRAHVCTQSSWGSSPAVLRKGCMPPALLVFDALAAPASAIWNSRQVVPSVELAWCHPSHECGAAGGAG